MQETYKKNGYIVKNIFTKDECDKIIVEAEALADENYSAIIQLHKHDFFLGLMKDRRIVDVVENLHGEAVGLM